MQHDEVLWLQIENTTRCNAACSVCNRNQHGQDLVSGLSLIDLDEQSLRCSLELFPNLEIIEFCGNRGDAIAAKNFEAQLDVVLEHLKKFPRIKVSFSTNGSLRNTEWWEQFAQKLHNVQHNVIFAIDGLADTNHIYRQRTDFDKIINNATAFIQSGGCAVWKYLPFQHNEHQIIDALKMSRALGFVDFRFVKQPIVPTKTYSWVDKTFIKIHPWSQQVMSLPNNVITANDCDHLKLKQVYLNANGYFHLCCHLEPSTTECGFDQLPHVDQQFENIPSNLCLEKCGRYVTIG